LERVERTVRNFRLERVVWVDRQERILGTERDLGAVRNLWTIWMVRLERVVGTIRHQRMVRLERMERTKRYLRMVGLVWTIRH
jgi:hypothetical protein